MASTITLAKTINWAKGFIANIDSTVNTGSEPAVTSANLIKQTILSPPFKWRWNRVTTGFIATAGIQDYLLSTWTNASSFALNTVIVDTNGNCQQVTTAGISGGSAPTWNVNTGASTTDNTVIWKNLGAVYGASSTYNLGYIETASVLDIGAIPNKWYSLDNITTLSLESKQGRPYHISPMKDDNVGNITFRLMGVPDKAYPINITLQQKPSLFALTTDTWGPIPDEYSYIYNWGFLTLMYMYFDDPKWAATNQKFVAALLSAQQGLTITERNIFLNNWESLTGQMSQDSIKQTQGNQARGM